jgi:heme exporter protein A
MARLKLTGRPLWLLDEPLAALDSSAKALVAAAIGAHCASGGIAIAATHEPLGLDAQVLRLGQTAAARAS